MSLVPLQGREHEPAVRSLLAAAPAGSGGILVGWADADELVACARLERTGGDELRLQTLTVAPERRGRGVGRRLIDSVADVATARRLVAEVDAQAAGFLARCRFQVEPLAPDRFRCTRAVEPRPAPSTAVAASTLGELEDAIRGAWGRDTSDDPDEWSEHNRARGQCAVTALLLRELLGGEILIAGVLRDGARVDRHAWNRLPSGLTLDLTRSQFTSRETFEEPQPDEPLLVDRKRYELLTARVRARLGV